MKRLITIFIMLSGVVLGQTTTYNLALTNNLVSFNPGAFDGAIFDVDGITTLSTGPGITGSVDGATLYLTNSSLGGASSDTGAVKLIGGQMTGGLTNFVGFVGNGAGLTNIGAASETDPIWTATQAYYRVYGGTNVTVQQTATGAVISAAAGGGSTTNAVTPSDQGNINANWTINLTAGGALLYTQTNAITNVTFTVASTNDITAAEVVLVTSTNSITWPAAIIWAEGSAPTTDTSDRERFVFSLYRGKITAAYLQDD